VAATVAATHARSTTVGRAATKQATVPSLPLPDIRPPDAFNAVRLAPVKVKIIVDDFRESHKRALHSLCAGARLLVSIGNLYISLRRVTDTENKSKISSYSYNQGGS